MSIREHWWFFSDKGGQSNYQRCVHRISCNCSDVDSTEVVDSTVKDTSLLSKRSKNPQVLVSEAIGFPKPTSNILPLSILQLCGQASKSSTKFADDRLQSSMSSKRACTQKCLLWTAQLCFAVLAPQSAGRNNILRRAQVWFLTMQQNHAKFNRSSTCFLFIQDRRWAPACGYNWRLRFA